MARTLPVWLARRVHLAHNANATAVLFLRPLTFLFALSLSLLASALSLFFVLVPVQPVTALCPLEHAEPRTRPRPPRASRKPVASGSGPAPAQTPRIKVVYVAPAAPRVVEPFELYAFHSLAQVLESDMEELMDDTGSSDGVSENETVSDDVGLDVHSHDDGSDSAHDGVAATSSSGKGARHHPCLLKGRRSKSKLSSHPHLPEIETNHLMESLSTPSSPAKRAPFFKTLFRPRAPSSPLSHASSTPSPPSDSPISYRGRSASASSDEDTPLDPRW